MNRKTKIVATMGPATSDLQMVERMIHSGMDVMRLNFSHGDFAEHQGRVDNAREVEAAGGPKVEMLQDLAGPKIRIGVFVEEYVYLTQDDIFILTTDEIVGDRVRVSVNYKLLPQEVAKGHHVFIQDGKMKLEVMEVKGNDVICRVIVGGKLGWRRGVNLPDSELSIHALTDKDRRDLEFGIRNGVNYMALSFVRKPEDIDELRTILRANNCNAKIVAKIETPQALACIDDIIERSDCVMVARGDLAIEIGFEKVPLAQKEIIKKCNAAGKFVITATHMLESMVHNPLPTRAEASDIANAIIDGTDAIMLSEESALGEYPVECVKVMDRVAREIEGHKGTWRNW